MHKLPFLFFLVLLCQCAPYIHTSSCPPVQHTQRKGEVAVSGGFNGEGLETTVEVSPIKHVSVAIGYRNNNIKYSFVNSTFTGTSFTTDSASYKRTGGNMHLTAFYTPSAKISDRFSIDIPLTLGYQQGNIKQVIEYSTLGGSVRGNYRAALVGVGIQGNFKEKITFGMTAHFNRVNYHTLRTDLLSDKNLAFPGRLVTTFFGFRFNRYMKFYFNESVILYDKFNLSSQTLAGLPVAVSAGLVFYPTAFRDRDTEK